MGECKIRNRLLGTATFGILALTSGLATAQSVDGSIAANASGEEIVVTAQRREQAILDVPLSVSAVSGEALRDSGIAQATDLVRVVPTLKFSNTGPTSIFTVRGVGPLNFQQSAESPIAYYTDDVYRGASFDNTSQMIDVARVEVLRGPQGTLFGRNASGGVVQVVSNAPGHSFGGRVSALYGTNNRTMIEGGVSVPLTDWLRTRTAFAYEADDGWQRNVTTGTRLGSNDRFYLREIIDLDITSDLSARLNLHGGESNGVNTGYGFLGLNQTATGPACSFEQTLAAQCFDENGFRDPDPDPRHVYSDLGSPQNDTSTSGASLQLRYEVPAFTILSITAVDDADQLYEEDADATPAADFGARSRIDAHQFSQEFRIFGEHGSLNWNVGAYYYKQELEGSSDLFQLSALYGSYTLVSEYTQDTEAEAVFGQIDYEIIPSLTLTAGVRYSEEEKSFLHSDNFDAPTFLESNQVEAEETTWRLAVAQEFTDDTMAYISVSTGFKSPAFNTNAREEGATAGADSESVTNYEIGFKTRLFNDRLTLSTAAFLTDYDDFQIVTVPPNSATGASVLYNVNSARITGLELEASAELFDGLRLDLAAIYLQSEIDAPGVFVGIYPIDGHDLPRTPELTLRGAVTYDWTAPIGDFQARVSASYQDDMFISPASTPLHRVDAYTLVDAGVKWAFPSNGLSLELLGENLTDEEYTTYAFNFASLDALQWGRARTFAVRLAYEW